MEKLSEQKIADRDANRDLQAEIRQAYSDLKQGAGIGRILRLVKPLASV